MNGSDFKLWRMAFGLSQQELAEKMGVTRTSVQNWEATAGALPSSVENGVKIWDRYLRQEQPLRGPLTLIWADGPMMIAPGGRTAMMHQEIHLSNAAVLARCQSLASNPRFINPLVMEGDRHNLWNMIELDRAVAGDNQNAPTMRNMLRWLARDIRRNAGNYVRSGRAMPTEAEKQKRVMEFTALAIELEQVAEGSWAEIVGQYGTVNAVLTQVRALGLMPSDALVSGLAQAWHAASMPPPGVNA